MIVLDSWGEKLRYIRGLEMTWEVTALWSSIHKQHTLAHYTIYLEMPSDFANLKTKLTCKIMPSSLETLSCCPH